MRQLVFPCGAGYEMRPEQKYPFEGAHVATNGSVRLLVGATGCTPPKLPDGNPAPCAMYCLKPGRHVQERPGYEAGELVIVMSCHGRLFEDGIDVTLPRVGKCPHCEKKRKYLAECVRAAAARKRRASAESGSEQSGKRVVSISAARAAARRA